MRVKLFENVANTEDNFHARVAPFMSLCDDDASLPNVMANDVFEGIYTYDSPNSQKTAHRTRSHCCCWCFFLRFDCISLIHFVTTLSVHDVVRWVCLNKHAKKVQNSQIFRYYFCLSHLSTHVCISFTCEAFIFTLKFTMNCCLVCRISSLWAYMVDRKRK